MRRTTGSNFMLINSFGRRDAHHHHHSTMSDLLVFGPSTEHLSAQQQQQQQQQQQWSQEDPSAGAEQQREDDAAHAHLHAQGTGIRAGSHPSPAAEGVRSSSNGAVRNGDGAEGAGFDSSSPKSLHGINSRVGPGDSASHEGTSEATDTTKQTKHVPHLPHATPPPHPTVGPHANGHANGVGLLSTGSTFSSSIGEGGNGHHASRHTGTNGDAPLHSSTFRHSPSHTTSSPEDGPSPPTAPPYGTAPTHPSHLSTARGDDDRREGDGGGEHLPSRPTSTSNNSSTDPFGDRAGGQVMAMPGEIARQLHIAGSARLDDSHGDSRLGGDGDARAEDEQGRGGGEESSSGPGSNASVVVVSGQHCPGLPNGLAQEAGQPTPTPGGDARGVPEGGAQQERGEDGAAPGPTGSPHSMPLPSPAHTSPAYTSEGRAVSTSPTPGSPHWSAFASYFPPWASSSFRRIGGFLSPRPSGGQPESHAQAPTPPANSGSNAHAPLSKTPDAPGAPGGEPRANATAGSSSSAHAGGPAHLSAVQQGVGSPATSPDDSRTQPSGSISMGQGRLGSASLSGSGAGFARFRSGGNAQPTAIGRTSLAFEEVSDEEEKLTAEVTQASTLELRSPPPSARTSIADSEQRAPPSPLSRHHPKDVIDALPQPPQHEQQQQQQPLSAHAGRPTPSVGSPHAHPHPHPHPHHKPGTLSTIHEIVPAGSGHVSSSSASPALLRQAGQAQRSASGLVLASPSFGNVVRARSGRADGDSSVPMGSLGSLARQSPMGPPSSGFLFPEVPNASAGASPSPSGVLGRRAKGTKAQKQLRVDIPNEQGPSNSGGSAVSSVRDSGRRLQHSAPFIVRDSGGATGGSAKGHGSRKLRAAKSPRFGKRSHLSEAEGGDGKDADGAAVEDGRASAGMGDLTSSRKHKRGRKPKKGLSKEDVAAKVSKEGNKLADQNMERMQSGLKWCKYGITKVLSKGSRRSIMLSQVICALEPFSWQLRFPHTIFLRTAFVCACLLPSGDLCPRSIFLGINNTIKEENDSICQVAIFAPLWVDNRTGFDLIFKDLDVPSAFNDLPFLIHHPVRAPGLIRDAICIDPLSHKSSGTPPSVGRSSQDKAGKPLCPEAPPSGRARSPKDKHASSVQPALLNDQSKTTFRLQDSVGNSGWCDSFKVSNSGKRFEIALKGSETTNISTVKRMHKAFGKLPRQLMQRAHLLPVASLPQSPSAYQELDEAAQQAAEELESEEAVSHGGNSAIGASSEMDSGTKAASTSLEASPRAMFAGKMPHDAFVEEGAEEKKPRDPDIVEAAAHIHLDEIADNVKVLHVQQPSLAGSASMPGRSNSSGRMEPTQAADKSNNLRNFIFKQQKRLVEASKSEASNMLERAKSMHETMVSTKDRLRQAGLPEGGLGSGKDLLLGSSKEVAPLIVGPSGTAGLQQGSGLTIEDRGRMERMARVLARECAKKVYVTIYAEGPMRVLCFAEEKTSITSVDDVNSVLNMAIRLQHVSSKVAEVDEELSKHLSITERTAQMDLRKAASKLALSDGQGLHSKGSMQGAPLDSKPSSLSLQPSGSLTPPMQRSSWRGAPGGAGPNAAASNWAKLRQYHFSMHSPRTRCHHARRIRECPRQQPEAYAVHATARGASGGDLKVRIISARGLRNLERLQHVYAKAMVRDQVTMTNMVMSSKEPEWRFEDVFRDVPASAELTIEVWGIPRYKEKKLFTNISKLSEKAREVGDKGLGAGAHVRSEFDKARGPVELLARLKPVEVDVTQHWLRLPALVQSGKVPSPKRRAGWTAT
ncbi:hypothetical protein DUNSADRAFT_13577 [Dunaliella salina]|uniref:C2 domain-containing protein n=1 Tax=Dunaliella salina TaxID=3046 RepID=A0ABQ7H362_DUNSA|nr:hypothetical protein DUNSADRAFT_13577 [Dunaliella salina]|eukprot:KAF5841304.1 hypothetical protein DUNSADRAFT_13577 [Dunaliella salina]